jgi:glycosyltransferase involved in cell wall biosynthesis
MDYPRVIILGETFRLNGGGGITMTNLFRDWPTSNIGVITDGIEETNPLSEYSYYQLGSEEIKFPFPFHIVQRHVKSGPYTFAGSASQMTVDSNEGLLSGLKRNLRPLFDKFLRLSGLYRSFYRIKLSESLKNWIASFNPDILYIQPFHSRIMQFGNVLYSELKFPYAIHIMDDSVNYINKSILFKNLLQHKIENDFRMLVEKAGVRMCISEAMAEEYFNRYGTKFFTFRNPIDTDKWLKYQKNDITVRSEKLKIIYNGRLFPPTLHSLLDLCKVVDKLNATGKKIELDIYTLETNLEFNSITKDLKGVNLCKPVALEDIPEVISHYDIFFLCLDFDPEAIRYSQFSISTRTSESMISGVPILLYAPSSTAMFRYFVKNNAGCIVGENDITRLEEAVLKLWNDFDFRKEISSNAIKTAMADSNSSVVRKEFRSALTLSKI